LKKAWFDSPDVLYIEKDGIGYVQFANLRKFDNMVTHCFTTRNGGVSRNEYSTLNLGVSKDDPKENVMENFRRISKALGISHENMVLSNQVHGSRIYVVDEKDKGKGLTRDSDILGVDGLVTDKPGIALVTFYADCAPLFFLDPVRKVIAVSHSGWRGTVKQIARETIKVMSERFESRPEDVVAAIGPSIGQCCFETGQEVYDEFTDKLPWSREYCKMSDAGKWHINLRGIIKKTLTDVGLKEGNICVSDICTKCNKDIFFSYRGDNGKTGSLAAIMQLL